MCEFAQCRPITNAAAMIALLLIAPAGFVSASASEEQSLQRGAVEDVTPQQKYKSAIREAGGAYKESLRECANGPATEKRACVGEAKATYDRDMALARSLLR